MGGERFLSRNESVVDNYSEDDSQKNKDTVNEEGQSRQEVGDDSGERRLSFEEVIEEVERREPGRVYTYGKYSGTIAEIAYVCPAISMIVSHGNVEMVISFLNAYNGTPEKPETSPAEKAPDESNKQEDDGQDKQDTRNQHKTADTTPPPSTRVSHENTAEKTSQEESSNSHGIDVSPEEEQDVRAEQANFQSSSSENQSLQDEALHENGSRNDSHGTEIDSPSLPSFEAAGENRQQGAHQVSMAVHQQNELSVTDSETVNSGEQNIQQPVQAEISGVPVRQIDDTSSEADASGENAKDGLVVAAANEKLQSIIDEVNQLYDDAPPMGSEDIKAFEYVSDSSELDEHTPEEYDASEASDDTLAEPGFMRDASAKETDDEELGEVFTLPFYGGDMSESDSNRDVAKEDEERVVSIVEGDMSPGGILELEQTVPQPELDVSQVRAVFENEMKEDTHESDLGSLELAVELSSGFLAEEPGREVEARPYEVVQMAAAVQASIDVLEQSKTAEECKEHIEELQRSLATLLEALGYENAHEIAKRLVGQYDTKTLKQYIAALLKTVTSGELTQQSQQKPAPKKHHWFGKRVVERVVLAAMPLQAAA